MSATKPLVSTTMGEIRNKKKKRTEWNVQIWSKLHRLANLDYAARGRVVKESFEMKDEYGRKGLDEHLLARLVRTRGANLHGLRLRYMCQRILDGVYRIGLYEEYEAQIIKREIRQGDEPECRVGVIASLRRRHCRVAAMRAGSNGTFRQIYV